MTLTSGSKGQLPMETKRTLTGWSVIRAYLMLPHAVPILVVMVATAAFSYIATGGNPGVGSLASLLIAMLGGQLAIGATNELVDVEIDRASRPHKPIPAGLVSRRRALTVVLVGPRQLLSLALAGRYPSSHKRESGAETLLAVDRTQ